MSPESLAELEARVAAAERRRTGRAELSGRGREVWGLRRVHLHAGPGVDLGDGRRAFLFFGHDPVEPTDHLHTVQERYAVEDVVLEDPLRGVRRVVCRLLPGRPPREPTVRPADCPDCGARLAHVGRDDDGNPTEQWCLDCYWEEWPT